MSMITGEDYKRIHRAGLARDSQGQGQAYSMPLFQLSLENILTPYIGLVLLEMVKVKQGEVKVSYIPTGLIEGRGNWGQ